MFLYVLKTLDLREPCSTNITLLLPDMSRVVLNEIVEDILIRVGKFVIPGDFIILDFDKDARISIIL